MKSFGLACFTVALALAGCAQSPPRLAAVPPADIVGQNALMDARPAAADAADSAGGSDGESVADMARDMRAWSSHRII